MPWKSIIFGGINLENIKKVKIQHVKNIGKYWFNEVIFDKTYTFKIESDNLYGDNGLIMWKVILSWSGGK